MDGEWIFDNSCALLLSLRWFFKGKQRFDEFDYNRIMERYIYIYIRTSRRVFDFTLSTNIRFNVTQNARGDDVIGYSEIRNDHISNIHVCYSANVQRGRLIKATRVNQLVYKCHPLFQPLRSFK